MKPRLFTTLILCALVSTSGCYFGRAKTAKTGAYVANGTAMALGSFFVASAALSGDCPAGADVSCGVGSGAGKAGALLLGAVVIAAGGLGLLINAIVPTRRDPAIAPPPATTGGSATIMTPGLPETAIELR